MPSTVNPRTQQHSPSTHPLLNHKYHRRVRTVISDVYGTTCSESTRSVYLRAQAHGIDARRGARTCIYEPQDHSSCSRDSQTANAHILVPQNLTPTAHSFPCSIMISAPALDQDAAPSGRSGSLPCALKADSPLLSFRLPFPLVRMSRLVPPV